MHALVILMMMRMMIMMKKMRRMMVDADVTGLILAFQSPIG